MDWNSEMAVVWLPKGATAYPEQFATRADPGTSNFFYIALDAFHAIYRDWPMHPNDEPWAYHVADQRLYRPAELADLREEWGSAFNGALAQSQQGAQDGPTTNSRS
jgi:hypothetical protein